MAKLLFVFLFVTLSALVSCAPQQVAQSTSAPESSSSSTSSSPKLLRVVRASNHDGTDHDHHDGKTDNPVLISREKDAVGGIPRIARDAAKGSQQEEGDTSKDHVGDPNNPVRAGDSPPNPPPNDSNPPFLVVRNRRDTNQQQPKLGTPVLVKTEDTTSALPESGPQDPKPKRDATSPYLGGPVLSSSTTNTKTEDGRDASGALPPTQEDPKEPTQHKRDTTDPKLGGPVPSSSTKEPTQHKRDTDSKLPTSTETPHKSS